MGRPSTHEIARSRWGRAVLGDWHPLVRDAVDLLRLTFPAGAIAVAFTGNWGGALRLVGTFVLVLIARWINPPRLFDAAFVVAMMLQAWGNVLQGFESFGWYDKVVHVVLSGSTAPLWYLLLVRLDAVPNLERGQTEYSYVGMVIVTFALGFSFGAGYEVYEYLAVEYLGADLAIGYADTIADMAGNAVASLLGGLLLMLWARSGTGTRRVSRARLAEERGG